MCCFPDILYRNSSRTKLGVANSVGMSIFPAMSASCDDGWVTMLKGEMISQSHNTMEETYVFLVVSPQRSQNYKSTNSFQTLSQPTSHATHATHDPSTTYFLPTWRTISTETLSADYVKLRSSDPNSTWRRGAP